jgi:hypothetical protein
VLQFGGQQELAQVASSTAYFLGLDCTTLLPQLLADIENKLVEVLAAQLNDQKESVLLDVMLMAVKADQVVL